ncbi:F-box domain-containing protein [Verticillium dahliae]
MFRSRLPGRVDNPISTFDTPLAPRSARLAIMDPPHITEFASERYFNKLNQLHEPSPTDEGPHAGPSIALTSQITPAPPSESTFILPLRTSKAVDSDHDTPRPTDQKQKSRFFGLRSKVSLLQKSVPAQHLQSPSRHQKAATAEPASQPFDHLFLALPTELQIQIVSALPLADILNLRRVSKTWHTLISLNEAPIVRHHLDHHIPAYALRLYPANEPTKVTFHHLCGLWHRLHVAAKLSFLMCEWITKEIFLRTTDAQRKEFAPSHERMRRRLIPLLFTIFHFFETYRKLHLEHIFEHGGHGLLHEPYTLNPIEARIMNLYDDQTLLRVHQVFPLVVSSFCRRLRPPSYVGRVERSLRGYLREKPADEVHVAILCLGGLRQVERLWEIKGYNSRRGAVDSWYNDITTPPPEPTSKPRRGLRALGRKKSNACVKDAPRSSIEGRDARRGSGGSFEDVSLSTPESGLVFNTSLSAGMPMEMLGHDNVRRLLPDLPNLQQIWLTTAEALILDRNIVERPQDIKRNAQVMLDLIKDDGIEEEDEWWYGRGTPESVRPPLEAIEEDLDEGV